MDAQKSKPSRIDDGDDIVDSVALYRQMTPSTRILALSDYYVLRHSSASNLVNVSLIVFGALPLSYRSYVFAIDYDWLIGSGPIAVSVVLTISYYILIARWRARTSQSKAVQEALCVRVGARDEAALLLLKEGAVRSIAGAVLDASEQGRFPELIDCGDGSASIDPREWAIDFGLLKEPTTTTNPDDNDTTKGPGDELMEEQLGTRESATVQSGFAEEDPFQKPKKQYEK